MRLLHFVRNDIKARIAEAIAKPVAARPERSGTATSEGHAQINKKRILNICVSKDTAERQRKSGSKFVA
ncbi:MAG: hypothetical protein N3F62_02490 [Bacteroidia bacterium]|nr:hypothetical protein [Bacteroidia bacterium]